MRPAASWKTRAAQFVDPEKPPFPPGVGHPSRDPRKWTKTAFQARTRGNSVSLPATPVKVLARPYERKKARGAEAPPKGDEGGRESVVSLMRSTE